MPTYEETTGLTPRTIRTFIAIDFPAAAKQELAAVQQALALACASTGVQWTPLPNFHLTLFYLGTTPAPLRAGIETALELAARDCSPFVISFKGLGAFPRPDRPRVVFLDVADPSGGLQHLHDTVCASLARFDFKPDFATYRPHVTLGKAGRQASSRSIQALGAAMQAGQASLPSSLIIDELVFFQSVPTRNVPAYEALQRMPLLGMGTQAAEPDGSAKSRDN